MTAVRPETRAVLGALTAVTRARGRRPSWLGRAGVHEVCVIQAGVGPAAARAAVAEVAHAPDVLVSAGFAGGLVAGLAPGALVPCRRVVWDDAGRRRGYDVPEVLATAVHAALGAAEATSGTTLLSSPVVIATPEAKAAAAARYGAIAVEMEAAALIEHARARGIAVLPLRVVLDPLELSLAALPPRLATSWGARVRALGTPQTWPLLATLRAHAASAAVTLRRAAATVLRADALAHPGRR